MSYLSKLPLSVVDGVVHILIKRGDCLQRSTEMHGPRGDHLSIYVYIAVGRWSGRGCF